MEGRFNGGFFGVMNLGGLYLEGLIFGILRYLDSENLLSNKQFCFRSKSSTAIALSGFADEVLLNMERGNICGAAFLDLIKALDTVNHGILISKLSSVGVPPGLWSGFLRIFVSLNLPVTLAVPQ